MNIEDKSYLYCYVQKAVIADPSNVEVVIKAITDGLIRANHDTNKRAMDFEAIAMLAVTFNNSKKNNLKLEKVIQEKIKTHKKDCHFVWDSFLGEE